MDAATGVVLNRKLTIALSKRDKIVESMQKLNIPNNPNCKEIIRLLHAIVCVRVDLKQLNDGRPTFRFNAAAPCNWCGKP